MKIQKVLDIFGLVIVAEYLDDHENFPNNFPAYLYISKKSNFEVKK